MTYSYGGTIYTIFNQWRGQQRSRPPHACNGLCRTTYKWVARYLDRIGEEVLNPTTAVQSTGAYAGLAGRGENIASDAVRRQIWPKCGRRIRQVRTI